MKKLKSILTIGLLSVMFASCEKGETGQHGPQGTTGDQGPIGPQGPTGNANCSYHPISLSLSLFSGPTSTNHCYYRTVTALPVVNTHDMLLAYLYERWDGSNYEWGALPGKHYYSTGTSYNDHYFSISNSGTTYIYIRNSNGAKPYSTMSGTLIYRFFIIKDALRSGSSTAIPEGLNKNNIHEVMKYYKIQDISINKNN